MISINKLVIKWMELNLDGINDIFLYKFWADTALSIINLTSHGVRFIAVRTSLYSLHTKERLPHSKSVLEDVDLLLQEHSEA